MIVLILLVAMLWQTAPPQRIVWRTHGRHFTWSKGAFVDSVLFSGSGPDTSAPFRPTRDFVMCGLDGRAAVVMAHPFPLVLQESIDGKQWETVPEPRRVSPTATVWVWPFCAAYYRVIVPAHERVPVSLSPENTNTQIGFGWWVPE